MAEVPEEIDVGAHGLVLRRYRLADAERALGAILRSLPEIRPWMPWAVETPTLDSVREFLGRAGVEGGSPSDIGFGLYDAKGEQVGAFGLHDRQGPGILEIGYWIRTDCTGRGYATATARALTRAALEAFPEVDRMQIRCDPANLASAAIPPKLGYRLERTDPSKIEAPGQTGSQLVWVLLRADYLATERW